MYKCLDGAKTCLPKSVFHYYGDSIGCVCTVFFLVPPFSIKIMSGDQKKPKLRKRMARLKSQKRTMSGLRKLSGQERLSQCSETSYTSRIIDLITDTVGAIAIDSLKNLPAQLQILH